MGFRFRKYINVLPGIRINLGKKGVSLSLGGNGLTRNISKHGTRDTVSIPGTGLSYSAYEKHPERQHSDTEVRPVVLYALISAIILLSLLLHWCPCSSMGSDRRNAPGLFILHWIPSWVCGLPAGERFMHL